MAASLTTAIRKGAGVKQKGMTEAEWLRCRFQRPMLHHVKEQVSQRKWRLFAAACCRRVWDQLADERSRRAVEVAERFADGLAKARELKRAEAGALDAFHEICRARTGEKDLILMRMKPPPAAFRRSAPPAVRWACLAAWAAAEDAVDAAMTAESVANITDLVAHCDLLREVVGNPFRPASLDAARLAGGHGAAKIAQASYDDRDFSRLPVLADALEEAGCDDDALLSHLRSPGPHVRGCWAIDLVLGKS